MFSVFTGSNFGRGFSASTAAKSPLAARLAQFRRQRAQLARSPEAIGAIFERAA